MQKTYSTTFVLVPLIVSVLLATITENAKADLKLHALFSDGMVLQREKPVRIFGFAKTGDEISVDIGGLFQGKTTANENGNWSVGFAPIATGTDVSTISVSNQTSGEKAAINDVLLGDVWVLGGQSNMEFELYKVYDGDLEVVSAHFPKIRLLTVPRDQGAEIKTNFVAADEFNSWTRESEWKGRWNVCTPETARMVSAIGMVFGRRLHQAGQIPIGLIDASRGGTTVETWTSRESLEQITGAKKLVEIWDQRVAEFDPQTDLEQQMKNWERHAAEQKKKGRAPRAKPERRAGPIEDANRPANCFNRMLAVLDGVAVRGVIWHQGYNNALGNSRTRLYGEMLRAMIVDWRTVFRDDELPFGIIGFSAGGQTQTLDNFEVRMIDPAQSVREAQILAARDMKNVAYVASWDQQMNWYHPFKKVALGERMARWAMAETLGLDIKWKPAWLTSHEVKNDKIILTFDEKIKAHDSRDLEGFAIAGEDRHFFPAKAEGLITGKDDRGRDRRDNSRIVVSHPLIKNPVAVRYAWARNPIGNAVSGENRIRISPLPCFRTDSWDYPEAPLVPDSAPEMGAFRRQVNELRRQAETWAKERKLAETRQLLESLEK